MLKIICLEFCMHNPNQVSNTETSYAGDISPQDAWDILSSNPQAVLVDVRTPAEWAFVGTPNLSTLEKKPVCISWRMFPSMNVNPGFETQICESAPDITKDITLCFICRSGSRSREAAIAMTQLGYTHCYNVEGGFEGELNTQQHRGSINGWKAAQLPWEQR